MSLETLDVRTAAPADALPGPGVAAARQGRGPHTPFTRAGLRALRTHAGTVAGVAVLGVLLWHLGTGVFLDGLRRIDVPTLAAALGIGLVTTVFSAWRWQLVARGLRIRLPLGAAVADYYRALFLNAALPGGVLGDVHRAVRHGRSSGDLGRGVRAVVLERVAGQLALAVAGAAVLLTLPSPVRAQARHLAPPAGLAALGALAVVLALRMNGTPSRRGRALRRTLGEAREGLLSRRNGPGVALSSAVVLTGHVAMFVVAAHVTGSAASVPVLLPLAVLALLAMGLPLNVGGFGPREGITAWAFGAAGLGAGTGLAVAVVYGVLSLVASLPGLLVLAARWYAGLRGRAPHPGAATAAPAGDAPADPGTGPGAPGAPAAATAASVGAGAPAAATAVDPGAPDAAAPVPPAGSGHGSAVLESPAPATSAGSLPGDRTPRTESRTRPPAPEPVTASRLLYSPRLPAPRRDRAGVSGDVSSEKYGPNDAARLASSFSPFSAEPREGRPMTPDSV